MTGSIALFFLITFLATGGCLALYGAIHASRAGTAAGQDSVPAGEARGFRRGVSSESLYDSDLLRDDSLSTISFWGLLLQHFDWVEIMKRHVDEAGMTWSIGRLTMFMLVAGTATLTTLRLLSGVPPWLALMAACWAAAAPYLAVLRRRTRRLRKLEQQLPEALDTLARALRAGHPVQVALEALSQETEAPLAYELRKMADARALGRPLEEALDQFARRVPISEACEFAAAVAMQNRTGGKLHEVLARLSENMRESEALKMEIESIAAHGKLTGAILTLMPIGIAGMMLVTNPNQMAILWSDPDGRNMIAAALVCLMLAHVVIRKLVGIRI